MSQSTQHRSPVATAYAGSLLELANERGQAEPIGQELRDLRQILLDNPSFRQLLSDPAISESEREQVIKRVFSGRLNQLVLNVLGVMNDKGRLGILAEVANVYNDLLDEQLGKIEVDVTVAQRLSPEQLEEVRQRVSAALKKDAVVHQYVDDSIIGGMVLRVQDRLIDASVRTQLQAMKQQLLKSRKQ